MQASRSEERSLRRVGEALRQAREEKVKRERSGKFDK